MIHLSGILPKISSKTFYHKDELQNLSSSTKATEFKICQNIFVLISKINRKIRNQGAESLRFTLNDDTIDKLFKKLP
jgi:hypothetical protein